MGRYFKSMLIVHTKDQTLFRLIFQGHTLSVTGLDLTDPVFSHGQLCVGASRVRRPQDLMIKLPNRRKTKKTKNIVFKEAMP